MHKNKLAGSYQVVLVCAAAFSAFDACAAGGAGSTFLGADFSYNGFLRFEEATKTDGEQNRYNQGSYKFNGVPIKRVVGNPLDGYRTTLDPTQALFQLSPLSPLIPTNGITSDVSYRGGVPDKDATVAYHSLRFEASPSLSWGKFSLIGRVRGLYDPGSLGYADFNPHDYDGLNGGIKGGIPDNYRERPNYFGYQVEGNAHPIPLELSGRNYQVDFPALFAQYSDGPLTVRVGNQSIAWGQAIFFRVFDTANGLDLRRHLILGRALEEYSDSRESALAARVTLQATDNVIADAFVERFQPSVLPNPNTPYNIIPSQFTIHDRYSQYGFDDKVNYGIKVKGDFGQYSLQGFAIQRYEPTGTFRWTASGVNRALPNTKYDGSPNLLGTAFNQYCNLVLGTGGQGCGPILAKTAFEVAPAGVFSGEEWFYYAGDVRLNGVNALNNAISDFPAAQQLLAQTVKDTQSAKNELDAFFTAGDGLHGHLERVYVPETVFGIGGSYVTEAAPGSIFDQAIINLELSYTPERAFVFSGQDDLRQDIRKSDDFTSALVIEKYQRFSNSFPATYLVAQYLFKSHSDLVERSLRGYGAQPGSFPLPLSSTSPGTQPVLPPGVNGAHYVALAFLQPFPNYIWEVSAATLIDVRGGILLQPGVQWKPQGDVTVNLFYNYINGRVFGANPNNNLLSTISFANEVGVRLGFQF